MNFWHVYKENLHPGYNAEYIFVGAKNVPNNVCSAHLCLIQSLCPILTLCPVHSLWPIHSSCPIQSCPIIYVQYTLYVSYTLFIRYTRFMSDTLLMSDTLSMSDVVYVQYAVCTTQAFHSILFMSERHRDSSEYQNRTIKETGARGDSSKYGHEGYRHTRTCPQLVLYQYVCPSFYAYVCQVRSFLTLIQFKSHIYFQTNSTSWVSSP
jgi:hypothetical protein